MHEPHLQDSPEHNDASPHHHDHEHEHHDHDHHHEQDAHHAEHDHGHHHGHDHHHDHEHGPAEQLIEDALILSAEETLHFDEQLKADDALQMIVDRMLQVAGIVAVDDAILGHIKALFRCAAGSATISITHLPAYGLIKHEGWQGDTVIDSCDLILNVLSLAEDDTPADELKAIILGA